MRHLFYWLWAGWLLYFAAVEGVAVYYEVRKRAGDTYTFTHFFAVHVSMGLRIALIAWLVYHFVWVHRNG